MVFTYRGSFNKRDQRAIVGILRLYGNQALTAPSPMMEPAGKIAPFSSRIAFLHKQKPGFRDVSSYMSYYFLYVVGEIST